MKIAILGNGPSLNSIKNWNLELKDKDIIVRIKGGGTKHIYSDELFKIKHYIVFRDFYSLARHSREDVEHVFKNYTVLSLDNTNTSSIYRILNFLKTFNATCKTVLNIKKTQLILASKKDNLFFNKIEKMYLNNLTLSTGMRTILYFYNNFKDSKIYLYGFDFDNSKGWFFDVLHKHSSNHNFEIEKDILFKKLNVKNIKIK